MFNTCATRVCATGRSVGMKDFGNTFDQFPLRTSASFGDFQNQETTGSHNTAPPARSSQFSTNEKCLPFSIKYLKTKYQLGVNPKQSVCSGRSYELRVSRSQPSRDSSRRCRPETVEPRAAHDEPAASSHAHIARSRHAVVSDGSVCPSRVCRSIGSTSDRSFHTPARLTHC